MFKSTDDKGNVLAWNASCWDVAGPTEESIFNISDKIVEGGKTALHSSWSESMSHSKRLTNWWSANILIDYS